MPATQFRLEVRQHTVLQIAAPERVPHHHPWPLESPELWQAEGEQRQPLAPPGHVAARQAVRHILQIPSEDATTTRQLRRLEDLMAALDAWDRFDHRRAIEVIERLGDRSLDQRLFFPLKRVIGSRCLLDQEAALQRWPAMKGHGLEAVEDLLRNAERRAAQDRYDDAVGRLYRAQRSRIQDCLKTRNHSLFAHGFSPISYGDWHALKGTLGPFLQEAIDAATQQARDAAPLQQLPSTLAELVPQN